MKAIAWMCSHPDCEDRAEKLYVTKKQSHGNVSVLVNRPRCAKHGIDHVEVRELPATNTTLIGKLHR